MLDILPIGEGDARRSLSRHGIFLGFLSSLIGGLFLGLLGRGLGLLLGRSLCFDPLGLRRRRFVGRLLLPPCCTRTAEIGFN